MTIKNAQNLSEEFVEIYTKLDGSAFTEIEKGYWNNYIYKDSRDSIEIYDNKVIGKSTDTATFSEFVEYVKATKLQLFNDGNNSELWVTCTSKDEEYIDTYKKQ